MRKLCLAITILLVTTLSLVARSGDEYPISFKQLPKVAQNFIQTHFNGKEVSSVFHEKGVISKNYEVLLQDGTQIEFDSKGTWTEVECKPQGVPESIIPKKIRSYVSKNHPKTLITKISHSHTLYEVELSNGMELKFSAKSMKFLRYDD